MNRSGISGTNSNVKVSIVVPVCNSGCYLEECLDSLIDQSLKEIEIICVNDGSTDESLLILNEYLKKDLRIRVYNTENLGYGHAMNLGMSCAQGEYIGIVESDDLVSPDMFKVLYTRAAEIDADFVKADFYRFFGSGEERELIYNSIAGAPENYNRVINPKKEKNVFRFIMNTWSGIYKREFLVNNAIDHHETPGASFQDNGFWFKTFCYAEKISFIDEALYYNRRDNEASSVKNKEKVYCANKEYELIRSFLKKNKTLEDEFIFQFSMKKYHTYLFTLNRIAPEYKKEYLEAFAQEFRQAREAGELSKAAFTPAEWTDLCGIMRSPEEYYNKKIKDPVEISVVIAANGTDCQIDECLHSIWKQTFGRFEVLCINAVSSNGAEKTMQEYCKRDPRFHLINLDSPDIGAAKNKGLDEAKGKYIIFLDPKDTFLPDMLKLIWQKIRLNESDICLIGSQQKGTGSLPRMPLSDLLQYYPSYRPFTAGDARINPFRCFFGHAWNKLFSRDFLIDNELRFSEHSLTDDLYFTYMALFKAASITSLDAALICTPPVSQKSRSGAADGGKFSADMHFELLEIRRELEESGLYEKYENYFLSYALHSCLKGLMLPDEKTSQNILSDLLNGRAAELGIDKLTAESCDSKAEYETFRTIKENGISGLKSSREKYKKYTLKQDQQNTKRRQAKRAADFPIDVITEEDYYKYCLNEVCNSVSYKIGRAITWLPRKIRNW